jgi:DNA-binding CsgD family transcriptional regulator/PAS domain-containing protein
MSQESLHSCITALYDAAMDTRAWQGLGARLAAVLDAQTMGRWVEDHDQIRELVATVPAEALAVYQQYSHALDLYATAAARPPQLTALLGHELVPPQVVRASEYSHDYGVPFGVCHVMGATAPLHTGASTMLGMAVHRPHDAPAFMDVERQRLDILLPHLPRALPLRQRLGGLEAQTGFAALEALALGVVIATADGAIVFANAAAEALVRRDEGLQFGGRRSGLGAVQPLEAQALRGLVDAVTHGGVGGMLRVTRRTQPPLAVLVAPLPTRLHPATALAPSLALVLITDPADGPMLAAQALQQLFGVTVAEADVALALVAGHSAAEIAAERRVSVPTVRTQIRQILTKTGALHLRHLTRLLSGLPAVTRSGTAP